VLSPPRAKSGAVCFALDLKPLRRRKALKSQMYAGKENRQTRKDSPRGSGKRIKCSPVERAVSPLAKFIPTEDEGLGTSPVER